MEQLNFYAEATHIYETVQVWGAREIPKILYCKFLRYTKKGDIAVEVLTDKGTRYKRNFMPHQLKPIQK